jgi:two-component system nitrogen regulation sensor histidine kinase NtrY
MFAAGFVAAVLCCALATGLALYGPAGPASDALMAVLLAALALVLALSAMTAARLFRVLSRRVSGGPTPRLHLRFVALFSFAAIMPAILMAVFFGVLLSRGMDAWFGERMEAAVESAADTARLNFDQIVGQATQDAQAMAGDLSLAENRALFEDDPDAFPRALEASAQLRAFTAAYVVDSSGQRLLSYEDQVAPPYRSPTADEFAQAQTSVFAAIDRESQVLRVLRRLDGYPDAYLYATPDMPRALFDALSAAEAAIADFRALNVQRGRIETFFVLIYLEAALLILAGSIWLALSAAGRVATPIGRLVEAADRVRRGELSARVEVVDEGDEVSALGRAFNLMTDQIARQRQELIDANTESEGRRRLIEAVLSGVSAGVLSVDEAGRVRLANLSAQELLHADAPDLTDRPLADIAPALADVAARAQARPDETVEQEVVLERDGATLVLNVRAAVDEDAESRRVVLTFDDITRLIAAQRNAAWRDVARRIAHEIKNPLTPIQLSAERLRRRYRPADGAEGQEIFDRCTDTIIRQVSDIGRMVDEFSTFARMPTPRIEQASLQDLAQETVFARRVASPDVHVSLDVPSAAVVVQCDARLASQALANILKNAAESIADRRQQGDDRPGRIDVRVGAREHQGVVEIQDNGLGWPAGARERLTEPYMTTREKGTGLGLAIVQRIMEDHGGRLELDVPASGGKGALVRLAFPLAQQSQNAEAAE